MFVLNGLWKTPPCVRQVPCMLNLSTAFHPLLPSCKPSFSTIWQSLWSGDVLACKVRSRGWYRGSDYVGLWPGEECWRGLQQRSGHPGACWADGIERGNKPSNSCGSQLLGLQQTLHSHLPPIPLLTVNICSDPLWRGAKESMGSSTKGPRRQKKCVFVFWEVS